MDKAWQAIEAGRAAAAKTQREKDWIEALAVFFKDYEKVDLRTRTLAYEAAMARLAERYPDDTEAAIFYALALNEAVDLNDKTYAKQFKAAVILQASSASLAFPFFRPRFSEPRPYMFLSLILSNWL